MSNPAQAHRLPSLVAAVVCGIAALTAMDSCAQNRTVDKEPTIRLDRPRAQPLAGGQPEQEKPLLLGSGEAADLLGGTPAAPAGTVGSSDRVKERSASDGSAMAYYVMCHDCHMGYIEEPLVLAHAKAGMSCDRCHGRSRAHYSDESNTTSPDRMFPADTIDPFCQGCHPTHDVPAGKVVALWRKRNSDKPNPDRIVCTDCHGAHRMKVRTVLWDKKTGRRLPTPSE